MVFCLVVLFITVVSSVIGLLWTVVSRPPFDLNEAATGELLSPIPAPRRATAPPSATPPHTSPPVKPLGRDPVFRTWVRTDTPAFFKAHHEYRGIDSRLREVVLSHDGSHGVLFDVDTFSDVPDDAYPVSLEPRARVRISDVGDGRCEILERWTLRVASDVDNALKLRIDALRLLMDDITSDDLWADAATAVLPPPRPQWTDEVLNARDGTTLANLVSEGLDAIEARRGPVLPTVQSLQGTALSRLCPDQPIRASQSANLVFVPELPPPGREQTLRIERSTHPDLWAVADHIMNLREEPNRRLVLLETQHVPGDIWTCPSEGRLAVVVGARRVLDSWIELRCTVLDRVQVALPYHPDNRPYWTADYRIVSADGFMVETEAAPAAPTPTAAVARRAAFWATLGTVHGPLELAGLERL